MEILQIIPATGWFAEFFVYSESEQGNPPSAQALERYTLPLAVWAVVRVEGRTEIVGFTADIESLGITPCHDVMNFRAYIHESECPDL